MQCNFNNIRAVDYTGGKKISVLYEKVSSEQLIMKGIYDPDLHVSMEMSEEEVICKERRRGFHRQFVIRQAAIQILLMMIKKMLMMV